MQTSLFNYIPSASQSMITELLADDNLIVKVKDERRTRHGDYR